MNRLEKVTEPRAAVAAAQSSADELRESPHAAQLQRGFRWLRFQRPLEAEFLDYFWSRYIGRMRWGLLVAVLIITLFSLKDYRTLPPHVWVWTCGIRELVMVPVILLGLALSFLPSLRRHVEWIIFAGVFVAMSGMGAAILISARLGTPLPYEGLLLFVGGAYLLIGMRPYKALACTLAASLGFIGASLLLGLPAAETGMRAMYLLTFNLICFTGGYSLEHLLRTNFLTERLAQFRALRDALTGLPNRRAALEQLDRAWRLAHREHHPVAVVLVDVDRFKSFNDRFGHAAGDECLTRVGRCLAGEVRRPMDQVARYGGEEFIVILYGMPEHGLAGFCEKLRQAVLDLQTGHPGAPADRLTVSIGGAWTVPAADQRPPGDVVAEADAYLYRAKHAGRNRCVVGTDIVEETRAAA